MAKNTETWKNAKKGTIVVAKFDRRGEVVHEIVQGGRQVNLTYDERMLNSDAAASEKQDFFKNGSMVPVRFADDSEDKVEVASNPNLKSEDELRALFKLQWKKFETEVALIENTTTLNRLREIASEGDATVRQVNVIETRLNEINPDTAVVDVTLASYGSGAPDFTGKPKQL